MALQHKRPSLLVPSSHWPPVSFHPRIDSLGLHSDTSLEGPTFVELSQSPWVHLSVTQDRLGMADDQIPVSVQYKMQVNFLQERKALTLQPDDESGFKSQR